MRPTDVCWTEDEVEQLKTLLHAGTRRPTIAKILGRTYSAVDNKIERLNMRTKDVWSAEQIEELKTLWNSGMARKDIAKQLNRTYSAVDNKAYALFLRRNRVKNTPYRDPRDECSLPECDAPEEERIPSRYQKCIICEDPRTKSMFENDSAVCIYCSPGKKFDASKLLKVNDPWGEDVAIGR